MGNKIDKICFCINSNDINGSREEQVNHKSFLIKKKFYILETNSSKQC